MHARLLLMLRYETSSNLHSIRNSTKLSHLPLKISLALATIVDRWLNEVVLNDNFYNHARMEYRITSLIARPQL